MNPPKLSLQHLVRYPVVQSAHPPVIILLHGYGSNEGDLFDLAKDMPPLFLVISVRAPIILGIGQYAWYPLDWSSGVPVSEEKETTTALSIVNKFVDEVIEKFTVDTQRVFLLGFSQGAIMSLSLALLRPLQLRGVVALSGMIAPQIHKGSKLPETSNLEIFLGHGSLDQVIPVERGHEARNYLETTNIPHVYHEYPIAHTISRDEQKDFVFWLSEKL